LEIFTEHIQNPEIKYIHTFPQCYYIPRNIKDFIQTDR